MVYFNSDCYCSSSVTLNLASNWFIYTYWYLFHSNIQFSFYWYYSDYRLCRSCCCFVHIRNYDNPTTDPAKQYWGSLPNTASCDNSSFRFNRFDRRMFLSNAGFNFSYIWTCNGYGSWSWANWSAIKCIIFELGIILWTSAFINFSCITVICCYSCSNFNLSNTRWTK